MLYPSVDQLMEKADSKYTLVVLAAKRARQLLDGHEPHVQTQSSKYVGAALEEIAADIIKLPAKK
ncbi:DNA-directed RNA polymerase subunit omega [Seinonella peptonophila]|uniref:DNA-directed RNA polymerase subunit omega n=1 Tax=Seinonella peptonophila TaxID=112248 RepID=A0A1M4UWP2_9BACL|nr:DNA-directed RNA polymerase subunit omega [Seinonella peptonophila]SHE61043.1 DNA-directed RNA polymerase subunit omega [Seinonella peptonophila]